MSGKVVLTPDSNAKYLTVVAEGVTVSVVEVGNGRTMITLESETPEVGTDLGLAVLSWISRTSWDKTSGFVTSKETSKPKRRKR